MAFCLPTSLANEFLKRLKSGDIHPDKLSEMSPLERRLKLQEFMNEEMAQKVAGSFESKLLLKNQQQGMITWIKQSAGLAKRAKQDMISRIERLTEVLKPGEEKVFLENLAAEKLGVRVTEAEAGKIADLAFEVQETRKKMREDFSFENEVQRMEHGLALDNLMQYVSDLKNQVKKPITPGSVVTEAAGFTKAIKASLDNSFLLRQGIRTLFTEPKIWARNAIQSYKDIFNTLRGKDAMRAIRADLLSRQNALNGMYAKEKLATAVVEEAFPTSLPQKVPVLGRFFKASEAAFTGFAQRSRADIFDKWVQIAQKTGGDTTGIGRVINSLTGRGNIGAFEPISKGLNNIFFSPRFLKSHYDVLTAHIFDPKVGPTMKLRAARNLAQTASGMAAIWAIASFINPEMTEEDATSADFGKIRVGNTRYDFSGGVSSLITLGARVVSGSTKSSTTGVKTKLNQGGFFSRTTWDVITDFFENKFSPTASVAKQWAEGKTFDGDPMTLEGAAEGLFVPIPITNYFELSEDINNDAAQVTLAMILDLHGVGTNTYNTDTNWVNSTSKELAQFQAEASVKEFIKANEEYNKKVADYINKIRFNKQFLKEDEETQKRRIRNEKAKFKREVFKAHGFKPKRTKNDPLPEIV